MKVKAFAIPMAFVMTTMAASQSFAVSIGRFTNLINCSSFQGAADQTQSLTLMPRIADTKNSLAYQDVLGFYNKLYSDLLYASFLRDTNAISSIESQLSQCGGGNIVRESLSWDELSQKLGPEKAAELKKQLETDSSRISPFDVFVVSSVTAFSGLVMIAVVGGASAAGAPAAVAGIIIGAGVVGEVGTAAWVATSRAPTVIRKIALHYDATDRQILDQEALAIATHQVDGIVGSRLSQSGSQLP